MDTDGRGILAGDAMDFLDNFITEEDPLFREMRKYAEENNIPILEKDSADVLEMLCRTASPARILEIGTGIGYSAMLMARGSGPECRVRSYELNRERHADARRFLARSAYGRQVQCICEDWLKKEETPAGLFDFIFIDAAKGHYAELFAEAEKFLLPGGTVVADNVFLNGWVFGRPPDSRRRKTMIRRMQDFLAEIKKSTVYDCCIIPAGDGMLLGRKKDDRKN